MPDNDIKEEDNKEFSSAFEEEANKKNGVVDTDLNVGAEDAPDKNGDLAAADDKDKDKDKDKGKEADNKDKNIDSLEGLPQGVIDRINAAETARDTLQHRVDSDAGRVNAYQKQVEGLQLVVDAGGDGAKKPSSKEITDALSGDNKKWTAFSEEYPEVAAALDARIAEANATTAAALNDQQAALDERLAPIIEKDAKDQGVIDGKYMEEHHPGWEKRVAIFDDKGVNLGPHPEFKAWLDSQPATTRSLADSDVAEDASSLMTYYENHLRATGKGEELQTTTPKNDGGEIDATVTALQQKRQRQLEDGQTVKSEGAGVRTSPDGDTGEFGSAFSAFANKKEQERRQHSG
jgi:hypothetical protein